ncbi:HNH endonuclease (plasmid) [Brucella anthropi]|uniref:HNH endonuclease n=1 Tax=Brucella anthropi (strain ATCC 49188 / DSM 6882 / CCUG 24695 / JCM 21032 / LMG 3331 / NBRC 15819 / NCTC 12168 / Alc 37) TaxID=439375 RepID=A6X7K8_BRUA4|nr:HNH endonuclease [Brucella anthropi ATCC 49188]QQC26867.1 HNH endonuclease [Brucella anthropi]
MNIGFESIVPTPTYAKGVSLASFAGLNWDSRAGIVTAFKLSLKSELRRSQHALCCYCRRPLGDPRDTDLEHIIEKAAHPAFTFEIRNLALSCSTCNSQKARTYKLLCEKIKKRSKKISGDGVKVNRSPVLSSNLPPVAISSAADFRWVHPHLDIFSNHIVLKKGYIFQRRTLKGYRTIQGLQLNALTRVEHRAAVEKLLTRKGPLSMAFGAFAQMHYHNPNQVFSILADVLRTKISTAYEAIP